MSKRLHRLKSNSILRDMISEVGFNQNQLVQPLFVVEGIKEKESIPGLKDNYRLNTDQVLKQIELDLEKGVRQFILFPVPSKGDVEGEYDSKVIETIKQQFKTDLQLWVDTCLCASLESGHCCYFDKTGKIDLEKSLEKLTKKSLNYAQAGADGISPSDMMDGRTKAIRNVLSENKFDHIPIMSYSTKFASHMYGPFRNAANSAPEFGDRKSYQLDVRSKTQAIEASIRCSEEGADLLMIKPGMNCIDLVEPIKQVTKKMVGAYQVSGEYAGLCLLAEKNLVDFNSALLESWYSFKRAGVQYIISYGSRNYKDLGL